MPEGRAEAITEVVTDLKDLTSPTPSRRRSTRSRASAATSASALAGRCCSRSACSCWCSAVLRALQTETGTTFTGNCPGCPTSSRWSSWRVARRARGLADQQDIAKHQYARYTDDRGADQPITRDDLEAKFRELAGRRRRHGDDGQVLRSIAIGRGRRRRRRRCSPSSLGRRQGRSARPRSSRSGGSDVAVPGSPPSCRVRAAPARACSGHPSRDWFAVWLGLGAALVLAQAIVGKPVVVERIVLRPGEAIVKRPDPHRAHRADAGPGSRRSRHRQADPRGPVGRT